MENPMKVYQMIARLGILFTLVGFANCIGSRVPKDIYLFDSATVVRSNEYKVIGKGTGQDSAFFLLGMFPVTKAPSVERAMSQILEKYPTGKTLINIKIQNEDKAYFPLGLVSAVNVTADVVGDAEETIPTNGKDKK